jgi:hypothetical protein
MYELENIKAFRKKFILLLPLQGKTYYMLVFYISTSHSTTKYTDDLIANFDKNFMSTPYTNNKQFLLYQLKWMGIYIAIGVAMALVLPFPFSLVGALGAFLLLNFIRTRRMLKRAGVKNMKEFFKSLSAYLQHSFHLCCIKTIIFYSILS